MVPHCLRLLGSPSKAVVYSPTPPDRFPYDIFQSVFRCSKVIIVLFVSRVRPRLMQRFPTDVGSRESKRGRQRELTNNCFHLTRNWIRKRQAASIRQRHQLQYKCYPHCVCITPLRWVTKHCNLPPNFITHSWVTSLASEAEKSESFVSKLKQMRNVVRVEY